MVADFHRRGVRVLFPMMMWDQGTRDPGNRGRKPSRELMKEIGADGINGDTQDGVPLRLLAGRRQSRASAGLRAGRRPDADEALAWNVMTWGQYTISVCPHGRPLQMARDRATWSTSPTAGTRDKTDDLQYAFFNGVGWESWENIWGIWNGITPRDAEATRRVATIERARRAVPDQPGLGAALLRCCSYGIFASRWPLGEQTVWTIVNRNEYDIDGRQIESRTARTACATSISITASN